MHLKLHVKEFWFMQEVQINLSHLHDAINQAKQVFGKTLDMTRLAGRSVWLNRMPTSVPGLRQLTQAHADVVAGAVGSAQKVLDSYSKQIDWLQENFYATHQSYEVTDLGFATGIDNILGGRISQIASVVDFPTRPEAVFDDFPFPTPSAGGSSLESLSADFAATDTSSFTALADQWRTLAEEATALAEDIYNIGTHIAAESTGDVIDNAVATLQELGQAGEAFAANANTMASYADTLTSIHASGEAMVNDALAQVAAIEDPEEQRRAEKQLLAEFRSYFSSDLASGVPSINNLMGIGASSGKNSGAGVDQRPRALSNHSTHGGSGGGLAGLKTPGIQGPGSVSPGQSSVVSSGAGQFTGVDNNLDALKTIGSQAAGAAGVGLTHSGVAPVVPGTSVGGTSGVGLTPGGLGAPGLGGGSASTGGAGRGGAPGAGQGTDTTRPGGYSIGARHAIPRPGDTQGLGHGGLTPGGPAPGGLTPGGLTPGGLTHGGVGAGGQRHPAIGRHAAIPNTGKPISARELLARHGINLGNGTSTGAGAHRLGASSLGAGRGGSGFGSGGAVGAGVSGLRGGSRISSGIPGSLTNGGVPGGSGGVPGTGGVPGGGMPGGGVPRMGSGAGLAAGAVSSGDAASGQGARHGMMGAPMGAAGRGAEERKSTQASKVHELEAEQNLRAVLGEPIEWTDQHLDFGRRPKPTDQRSS